MIPDTIRSSTSTNRSSKELSVKRLFFMHVNDQRIIPSPVAASDVKEGL